MNNGDNDILEQKFYTGYDVVFFLYQFLLTSEGVGGNGDNLNHVFDISA